MHRIDDDCETPQAGIAKRNPTLEAKKPRVARDAGLHVANPTWLLRQSESKTGAFPGPQV